ncbi:uncharacterized protein [Leptinotarsa decemlineata]|uniref:uncharacterized protein n=1 Tax=Leptinotarsa decemlineata TaxID=7539 RepID=UPI003D307219
MHIFPLILLLLITRKIADTAPIDPLKSLIEGLNKRCPSDVESLHSLKFQNCPDYVKLNNIDKLTRETEKEVLCALFYDSLLSFCKEVKKQQITLDKLVIQPVHNYTPKEVCEKLFPDNRTLKNDLSKVILPGKCEKLCTTYEGVEPTIECSLAYYFTTVNVSSLSSNMKLNQTPSENSESSIEHVFVSQNQSGLVNPKNKSDNDLVSPNNQISETLEVKPSVADTSAGNNLAGVVIPKGSKSSKQKISGPEDQSNIQSPVENPSSGNDVEEPDQNKQKEQSLAEVNPPPHIVINVTSNLPNNTGNNNKDEGFEQAAAETPTQQKSDPTDNAEDNNGTPTAVQQKMEEPALTNDEQLSREEEEDKTNMEFDENLGEKPDLEDGGQAEPELVLDHRSKSNTLETAVNEDNVEELDGGSYFFSYFMVICVFFVLGYVGYHNRIKVMALVLEGKRNKRQYRGRRPNSANYHKLDSNLEEAISSTCTKNSNNIIY